MNSLTIVSSKADDQSGQMKPNVFAHKNFPAIHFH